MQESYFTQNCGLKCCNSITNSGLRRVRNCVGELALHFETVASFYMCQPNHGYSHFMFSLHIHSDPTRAIVVAGVLSALCLVRATPPREYPTVLFTGLWPRSFHVLVQHLSGIYYVL